MGMEEEVSEQVSRRDIGALWFLGGCALSITTLASLVLLLLLLVSLSLNIYLVWTMSGYKITISRPTLATSAQVAATPTGAAVLPSAQPVPTSLSGPPLGTGTPTPAATIVPTPSATVVPMGTLIPATVLSTLEVELATLSALATQVAETGTPAPSAQPVPTSLSGPPLGSAQPPLGTPPAAAPTPAPVPTPAAAAPSQPVACPTAAPAKSQVASAQSASLGPLPASANSYALMPIEGQREIRPAAEHGDLNLKLRDPQPAKLEAKLIDIPGAGSDPNAPRLSRVLKPDIVATYLVHDWNWGCNCKGPLIQDGRAVLVGIKTTPGDPIFIPPTPHDIYQGKDYATLLYADEDSLTFVYARVGNVVKGYTVHYLGLQTDPNLLKLFRESQGNNLPGLTLDTPVGLASSQLIVAIRDNGAFMDARSRLDWWR
jgi:hypothetical protein